MAAEPTRILIELEGGDATAADRLFPLVYAEMRALAESAMRREAAGHTLQPTALAHEAYLKLIEQKEMKWTSMAHFLAIAATVIRRVLVDHARSRHAAKRGGGWGRLTLSTGVHATDEREVDVLDLHNALSGLEALHERQAAVVQMRFFAGMSEPDVAHVLGVSRTTVANDWAVARAWLSRELSD